VEAVIQRAVQQRLQADRLAQTGGQMPGQIPGQPGTQTGQPGQIPGQPGTQTGQPVQTPGMGQGTNPQAPVPGMPQGTPVMPGTNPAPTMPGISNSPTDSTGQLQPYTETPFVQQQSKITKERLAKAMETYRKYKDAKASVNERIITSQQWWKLDNWRQIHRDNKADGEDDRGKTSTPWLWNCIVGKHADHMDSYPEPLILPRAFDDQEEATRLSKVVPVILDMCGFEQTYSDCGWQKMIEGTACYSVTWDKDKYHGLGDVSIHKINLLNLAWEPGISDIQDSRHVFHGVLIDNDIIEQMYPQAKGRLGQSATTLQRYEYDDSVDTTDKSLVIDWYYHQTNPQTGQRTLQFCKFVNDVVLYATEDDPETAQAGLYDDGMYPFVLDPLFPVEGSICGYGYVDIGKGTQKDIDVLSQACVMNAAVNAIPRYMMRQDGSINEEEFCDFTRPIVHYNGSTPSDAAIPIVTPQLPGNTMNMLQQKIDELKFVTGNTDVNNGSTPSGVTAAAAIQALKEDSGRSSKDSNRASYRAYKQIIGMVIERIRQFYDVQRQFRITGDDGQSQFVNYSNAGLVPQDMGTDFDIDMGYRVPEFDIDVHVQREDAYTRLSQNELAIQLYNLGVFEPQRAPQALQMLDMMDFKGKDELKQKVKENGDLAMMLQQVLDISIALAGQAGDMNAANQLAAIGQQLGMQVDTMNAVEGMAGSRPLMSDEKPTSPEAGKVSKPLTGGNRSDNLLAKATARSEEATRV